MSGWVGKGVSIPFPTDLVEEGTDDVAGVFDDGFGVGEEEDRKEFDIGVAEDDTVGLAEDLDAFELVTGVGVDVGVAEALGIPVVMPGGASKRASTQYDFPFVKPEQLGPTVGFCI
jgi:hypothetical protein